MYLNSFRQHTVDSRYLDFAYLEKTAYLEAKIWSLFEHWNLTTCNKILWKRNCSLGAISPLFYNILNKSLSSGVKFICEMWLFDLFSLNCANLICRGTDILKYFRESLGLRDNGSRLYIAVGTLPKGMNKPIRNDVHSGEAKLFSFCKVVFFQRKEFVPKGASYFLL